MTANIAVREAIEERGSSAIAKAMGLRPTTVDYWRSTDSLPAWRVTAFLAAVRKVPPKSERKRRKQ